MSLSSNNTTKPDSTCTPETAKLLLLVQEYEAKLRLFDRTLSSITDFAYTFDLSGRFTFANRALLDLWNLSLEQVVGRNFADLKYPADLALKLQGQIEQVIQTRRRVIDETQYESPTGKAGYYQYIFSPVLDPRGNVEAVAGSTRDISQQKEIEAALRASELRRKLALESAEIGSWHVDPRTMTLHADERFRAIFGVDAEQLTYEQALAHIHPDDQHRVSVAVAEATRAENPIPYAVEYRVMHPDGVRWVFAKGRGNAGTDSTGRSFVSFDGTVADITDRKQADERARTILESITDAFFALDSDWRFSYLNPQAMRLLNLKQGEVIGRTLWEVYPGLLGSEFERAYRRTAAERIALSVTSYYPDHDRWYEAHSYPSTEGISIYFRDVSQRMRAEEHEHRAAIEAMAAAEANAKFRAFFEQGTYFAGVMALDGTVIEANRLCLDGCGFTREEVIGKKFWECGWWNKSPTLVEMIRAGSAEAAAGHFFHRESAYFVADGSERFVDLVIAPVTDNTGRVLFIAPSGIDITDRKKMEDEREQLLLAERAARDEAEHASRAKDKFLAVLSHELRTPLSPVAMAIPAMAMDPDMPLKFREDLDMVRRNIELEVKLIDDLLDLSRVTSGKLRLHIQPVQLHELLHHAIHNSLSDTPASVINIQRDFAAANDRIDADPARLQQVFWNLLRNAVKFTPDRGTISISTRNSIDGGQVFVEVRDTGAGIEPQVLPRIFDAFEQGTARTTRQFGGLGLGLAIAKAVVEMHGGAISASSAGKDQGAAFLVCLSVAQVRDLSLPLAAPLRHSQGHPSSGTRVLLVEDHPDTARILARLLKRLGFVVQTAHSVASALQCAAVDPFDVVVSDIGLPDATGYELMEQLRALYGIKGIALSGYGMEDDMRKSREAGFVDHIVKPVNVTQLEETIRRVVKG